MQIIYLDISNKGVVPTVYAKQNDVGRKFAVILTDSGLPYIPEIGSVFSVWYKGASGEGNYTDIGDKSAFSLDGNKVEVEMIVQMLSAHGDGILCLTLNSTNGNQISSWNIPYLCEKVPGFESEDAKAYYTAFSKAVENLPYPDTSLSVSGKAADSRAVGDALKNKLSTDGTIPMTGNMPMGGFKVTGLGTPTNAGDAVPLGFANQNFAPAGYGFGGTAIDLGTVTTEDDLTTILDNAHKAMSDGEVKQIRFYAKHLANFEWYGTISRLNSINCTVVATTSGIAATIYKYRNDSGWNPVEWENPQLYIGAEYRTTERYDEKPVYAKIVNFGALPNATYKTVSLGISYGQKVVLWSATTSSGAGIPYTDTANALTTWMLRVKNINTETVTIETTGNYSTLSATVFVKYTKSTD